MRTVRLIIVFIILLSGPFVFSAKAQSFEIQQLVLNIQKLSQLKSHLTELYRGYQILNTGYTTIKSLSEGNFSLHKTFLDGLLAVSPTVKKYKRIADVILLQKELLKTTHTTLSSFRMGGLFDEELLHYIDQVYTDLVDRSLKNLDELLMIITAGQLRMNDAERLVAIDRVYNSMKEKIDFLRHFSQQANLLHVQRQKLLLDNQALQQLQQK